MGGKWKAYAANFGIVWLLRFAVCASHCAVGFISNKTVNKLRAVASTLFAVNYILEAGEKSLGAGEHIISAGENSLSAVVHILNAGRKSLGAGRHILNAGEKSLRAGRYFLGEVALFPF